MITVDDVRSALPDFARGAIVKVRQHSKDYRIFEIMLHDPRPNQKPRVFSFHLDSENLDEQKYLLAGCVKKLEEQLKDTGLLRVGSNVSN